MTQYDQKILFTALAFVAVVLKDGDNLQQGGGQKVNALAQLIEEFCAENVACCFTGKNEDGIGNAA